MWRQAVALVALLVPAPTRTIMPKVWSVRTVGYAQIEFEPSSHWANALWSSDASIGIL